MANSLLSAAYSGLLQRGFSPVQAAALAGNIEQESSGNPQAWNAKSGAGGLVQWRLDRLTGLQNYAKETGRSPGDMDTQLDYLVNEMKGPEAKSASKFLAAQDVPSANAALKGYLRYGPTESGNRLQNALSFAGAAPQSNALMAADSQAQNSSPQHFVNPAFQGSMPAPQPAAVAPPPASAVPAPSPATAAPAGPSDDDILSAWTAPAATPVDHPAAVGDRAAEVNGTPASSDDALLAQFTATPSAPETPGALGNNPMAVKKSNAPTATAADYQPSAVPLLDQISAFGNATAANVPIIGPMLQNAGNSVDAGFNNLLAPVFGFQTETSDDVAKQNAAEAAKFPMANTAGAITGQVAPLVAAGSTVLGGRLLGTTGNLLTRTIMGGASNGAIQGADTIARGGSVEDARNNALLGTVLGGALAPAASAVAGGGRSMLPRAALGAGAGAAIGGAGTLAAGGSLEQAEHNALTGAGIGAGAGVAGSAANKLLSAGANPAVAQLAQMAIDKYKIPLGPGQITTNPAIRMADSVVNRMPLSGGTASREAQTSAFNRAVSQTFGENADALTPDVMANAKSRIGAVFDSVAQRTPIISADQTFDQSMLDTLTNAQQVLQDSEIKPLANQFDAILNKFQQGGNAIDGQTYQALTRKGTPLDRLMQSDNPNIRFYAGQMRDALDDALQRAAPPDALADLQQARSQYKALKTVEPLAAKAATGTISPALLSGAVRQSYGDVAYGGGGDLSNLARIGQQFLKEPANSGTPERLLTMKLLGTGGAGAAGITGLAMNPGAIPLAALGAAGYLGASKAAGSAMRSKTLGNMLIQGAQGLPGPGTSQGFNALLRGAGPTFLPPGIGGPADKIIVRGATPLPPNALDPGRPF